MLSLHLDLQVLRDDERDIVTGPSSEWSAMKWVAQLRAHRPSLLPPLLRPSSLHLVAEGEWAAEQSRRRGCLRSPLLHLIRGDESLRRDESDMRAGSCIEIKFSQIRSVSWWEEVAGGRQPKKGCARLHLCTSLNWQFPFAN